MDDPGTSVSVGMVDRGEEGLEQGVRMRSCRGAAATTNDDVDKIYSSIQKLLLRKIKSSQKYR